MSVSGCAVVGDVVPILINLDGPAAAVKDKATGVVPAAPLAYNAQPPVGQDSNPDTVQSSGLES
jgi:hypothetical protein